MPPALRADLTGLLAGRAPRPCERRSALIEAAQRRSFSRESLTRRGCPSTPKAPLFWNGLGMSLWARRVVEHGATARTGEDRRRSAFTSTRSRDWLRALPGAQRTFAPLCAFWMKPAGDSSHHSQQLVIELKACVAVGELDRKHCSIISPSLAGCSGSSCTSARRRTSCA